MRKINELKEILPHVDCGICGAPSCRAFAEDIVQKGADIRSCVFVQKMLLQNNKLDLQQAIELMKKTWGDVKFDQKMMET
jgi:Na+-translocating ferredoxin:NAD+ oxidoreductase RNF subunit RnfB